MSEWVKCNDRMPHGDGEFQSATVLVALPEYKDGPLCVVMAETWVYQDRRRWIQSAEFCEAEGGWDGATLVRENLNPSHWMPLPAPPAEGL